MFGFVSLADLGSIIAKGIDKIPTDIDMVVGIPRSGMIPAYMIGLYRNLPVTDLPSFLAGRIPGHGFRELGTDLESGKQPRSILLVDDSISSGRAMRDALSKITANGYQGKTTTCAVIASPNHVDAVDFFLSEIPHPRIFEWNAFHHLLVEDACFDMDGILCVDPTEAQNDDGPRYRDFLSTASPRFRPTRKIAHIVSARLEKYRGLTEQWLADNHVSYGQLHLIDLPSGEERRKQKAHCPHKARVYKETGASIFFESEPTQAQEIARLSGKPVLCTDDMRLYMPGVQLKAMPKIVKWHLARPISRVRSKMRSLFSALQKRTALS